MKKPTFLVETGTITNITTFRKLCSFQLLTDPFVSNSLAATVAAFPSFSPAFPTGRWGENLRLGVVDGWPCNSVWITACAATIKCGERSSIKQPFWSDDRPFFQHLFWGPELSSSIASIHHCPSSIPSRPFLIHHVRIIHPGLDILLQFGAMLSCSAPGIDVRRFEDLRYWYGVQYERQNQKHVGSFVPTFWVRSLWIIKDRSTMNYIIYTVYYIHTYRVHYHQHGVLGGNGVAGVWSPRWLNPSISCTILMGKINR